LDTSLKQLPPSTSHQETRSEGDKLTEVLEVVRTLSRAITDDITPQLESLTHRSSNRVRVKAKDVTTPNIYFDYNDETHVLLTNFGPNDTIVPIVNILLDNPPLRLIDLKDRFPPDERPFVDGVVNLMKRAGIISYHDPLKDNTLISLVDEDEKPDFYAFHTRLMQATGSKHARQ